MLSNIAIGILISLLLVSVVILFCAIVIRLYLRKIQAARERELSFQKALNAAITETQEELLNTISGELHDDAGQQLTYINFLLENCKLEHPQLKGTLDTVSASVRNLADTIRSISHSLNNQPVMQQDIARSIETEVVRLQRLRSVTVDFEKPEPVEANFSANQKIMLYRIFQEIINNALKHSQADKITVRLTWNPRFCLSVTDNGRGFAYHEGATPLGIGFKNIFARAEIINIGVEVTSSPDKGTSVRLFDKSNQL